MRPRVPAVSLVFGLAFLFSFVLSIHAAQAGEITLFYTVEVKPGLQLVGNPLDNGQSNTVQTVLTSVPDGTTLYKFTNSLFTTNLYLGGSWGYPSQRLTPGDGAFIFNATTSSLAATFAGNFLQGQLTNEIPSGLSLRSSMAFKSGGATTDLGIDLGPFDNLYRWQTNHFVVYTVLPGGGWYPSEPKISIAESFFVNSASGTNWVQSYQP